MGEFLHDQSLDRNVPRPGRPMVLVDQRHLDSIVATRLARMLTSSRRVVLPTRLRARRTFVRMASMRLLVVAFGRNATRLLAARWLRLLLTSARHRRRGLAAATVHRAALSARIALALVAERRALVLAARQLLAAQLVARRTLAVAALAIARVFLARSLLATLDLARELLGARQLFGVAAAAAPLLRDQQTLSAAVLVTALRADVLATVERLFARSAARCNLLAAWRLRPFLATRTASRLASRARSARVCMATSFALVSAAGEPPTACGGALPALLGAAALLHDEATLTALLAGALAGCTRQTIVAQTSAGMCAARK